MFTIKAAAELTGVPVATLRAWERRYGIALPDRSDSGYRLYDERALGEVRIMQQLLHEGWAAKQAADEVLRRRDNGNAFETLAATHAGLPGPEALVSAAGTLDETLLAALLDTVFTRGSFEHVIEAWLTPGLHAIGDAWQAGKLEVSAEHFVSAAVMRRLGVTYDATNAVGAARVVVGLPAGGEHEIPALAFTIAARRAGVPAQYLGTGLPAESWVHAVANPAISTAVISVATPSDARESRAVIDAIRAARPDLRIVVGGRNAAGLQDADLLLPDSITDAARALADFTATPTLQR